MFLYLLITFLGFWIGANLLLPLAALRAFDPAPFSALQCIATLSALLIATMVLITQNRQLKLMEKRSHLDLEIGLLSEHKIAKVIALLEELRRDMPDVRNRHDPVAKAMETGADPHSVAQALEEKLEAEVRKDEAGE